MWYCAVHFAYQPDEVHYYPHVRGGDRPGEVEEVAQGRTAPKKRARVWTQVGLPVSRHLRTSSPFLVTKTLPSVCPSLHFTGEVKSSKTLIVKSHRLSEWQSWDSNSHRLHSEAHREGGKKLQQKVNTPAKRSFSGRCPFDIIHNYLLVTLRSCLQPSPKAWNKRIMTFIYLAIFPMSIKRLLSTTLTILSDSRNRPVWPSALLE